MYPEGGRGALVSTYGSYVAIWDNRATHHYGVADYDDARRRLHRFTSDVKESIRDKDVEAIVQLLMK